MSPTPRIWPLDTTCARPGCWEEAGRTDCVSVKLLTSAEAVLTGCGPRQSRRKSSSGMSVALDGEFSSPESQGDAGRGCPEDCQRRGLLHDSQVQQAPLCVDMRMPGGQGLAGRPGLDCHTQEKVRPWRSSLLKKKGDNSGRLSFPSEGNSPNRSLPCLTCSLPRSGMALLSVRRRWVQLPHLGRMA